MSEARKTTRVNRALRLLGRLTLITTLGLVLSLSSPFVIGGNGPFCGNSQSSPGAAGGGVEDWAGEQIVALGWPVNWLAVTRIKGCGEPQSHVTGLFEIEWVGLAVNEGIILVGMMLSSWLYARLRRAHVSPMSGGREIQAES